MTQNEGHPPVAYLDRTKGYSKWVHIHIPFSGPHKAQWVEDKDGTNGHWEGRVCDTEGDTIPGWQDEVLFWQEIPLPMQWEGRVELPPQLAPLGGMSVNDFKSFYTEYLARFHRDMEKGSQIAGGVPDMPSDTPKEEPEMVDTSAYLNCFDCRKHITLPFDQKEGWRYQCKEGRETKGANPMTCPGGDVQRGFQIGGYYSHMWFETEGSTVAEGANHDPCLNWMIASDGEFPTENGEVGIEFHLCDFTQIERWVAFWGKELRKRGWITEVEDAE